MTIGNWGNKKQKPSKIQENTYKKRTHKDLTPFLIGRECVYVFGMYMVLSIDLMPQLSVPLGRNLRSTASSADAWFFPSPVCRIIFPFVIQMTPLPRELQSSVGPSGHGGGDPPPYFD